LLLTSNRASQVPAEQPDESSNGRNSLILGATNSGGTPLVDFTLNVTFLLDTVGEAGVLRLVRTAQSPESLRTAVRLCLSIRLEPVSTSVVQGSPSSPAQSIRFPESLHQSDSYDRITLLHYHNGRYH